MIPWLTSAVVRRKWLVGVSGGADSVALMHAMHEAGCRKVVVCHLHHGLRGVEADRDARFVKKLAERMGYPCVCERADVVARMDDSGESMETAARAERLAFFARVARRERCRHVLLAHHADDQAETVLWNLLRGSYGLRGMESEKEMLVNGQRLMLVRPLLHLRHEELKRWLMVRGWKWREDGSNSEPVAVRNRLRAEVFPLLEEIAGRDVVGAICRMSGDFAEMEQYADDELQKVNIRDPQGRIHLGALGCLPGCLQKRALADYLRDHGVPAINRGLLEAIIAMTDPSAPAVVNLPGGARIRRAAKRIWIDP